MTHPGGRPRLPEGTQRVRITVTLRPDLLQCVRQEAERTGTSISEVVERALREFLRHRPRS